MSFVIVTDSLAGLPLAQIAQRGLVVIPLSYTISGKEHLCLAPEGYDSAAFFQTMKLRGEVSTSMVPPHRFLTFLKPLLRSGLDLLFLSASSGLSSSYQSACMAAEQLREEFPQRKIIVVDSLCASMGQGFLVHQAVKLRDAGETLEDTAQKITDMRLNVVHNFTVDDLGHLHRGGRVSKATAVVGSLMGIKPILHVDDLGHLTSVGKARGRKASIQALVDRMEQQMKGFDNPEVFISHGDCPEDAQTLADMVRTRFGIENIMIGYIGPVIGTHSGPGTLALYFFGSPR